MKEYKHHLDLAAERFSTAKEMMEEEREHLAAHLFINAAINYHNALSQKFLKMVQSHKQHSDTSYFAELSKFLSPNARKYKEAYIFLIGYKSQADYGENVSATVAKQIERRAGTVKEIAEALL